MSSSSLEDLAVFVAVVERGSFTAAAERLGISKSHASKCVDRLERSIGVRLLQRTTRRLRITDAGSTLHQAAHAALVSVEEAEATISAGQKEPRGKVRVSAPVSFGAAVLPAVVGALCRRYPQLQFEFRLNDDASDLVADGIDVAIRIAERVPDSSTVFRRIGSMPRVTCASPAYLQACGPLRTPDDLLLHDCIVHTRLVDAKRWTFLMPSGKRQAYPVRNRLAIDSIVALRTHALAGLGIIQISRSLVDDDLRAGTLREVLTDYAVPALSVFARYPARRLMPPRTRVFIEALAAAMRE